KGSSPARRPTSSSPAMSSPSSRSAETVRSDVEDDFGEPAARLGPDDQPMPRRRLDLVVQDVPVPIDRLTGNNRFQAMPARVDTDVEALIESMPGLATEDQLVQPTEQEVLGRFGRKGDGLLVPVADVRTVGDDHVEQARRGRTKQVRQVT